MRGFEMEPQLIFKSASKVGVFSGVFARFADEEISGGDRGEDFIESCRIVASGLKSVFEEAGCNGKVLFKGTESFEATELISDEIGKDFKIMIAAVGEIGEFIDGFLMQIGGELMVGVARVITSNF